MHNVLALLRCLQQVRDHCLGKRLTVYNQDDLHMDLAAPMCGGLRDGPFATIQPS